MTGEKAGWHIYIVRCGDGSLYTGIATDITRRISEHQNQTAKCAKYLRGRTPITLVYQESMNNRSQATKRELEIKKLSKQEKEALIRKGTPQKQESSWEA